MQMAFDLILLRDILSIPSQSHKEKKLAGFVMKWLRANNIEYHQDSLGNIYAIKSPSIFRQTNRALPCVVCHLDTTHMLEKFRIIQELKPNAQGTMKKSFKAYDEQGYPSGIGGDDKCGVYACLVLFSRIKYLKAVFFVSEEVGQAGSRNAEECFFKDVGYVVGLDSPGNHIVHSSCNGVPLFDRKSMFAKTCHKVLETRIGKDLIYTTKGTSDVCQLRKKFNLQCINLPIGYYNNHTRNEYVVIEDIKSGIKVCQELIKKLGFRSYH